MVHPSVVEPGPIAWQPSTSSRSHLIHWQTGSVEFCNKTRKPSSFNPLEPDSMRALLPRQFARSETRVPGEPSCWSDTLDYVCCYYFSFCLGKRSSISKSNEEFIYDLVAVCCHKGTTESGHITAYCKNLFVDQWFHYNDHNVRKVTSDYVRCCDIHSRMI